MPITGTEDFLDKNLRWVKKDVGTKRLFFHNQVWHLECEFSRFIYFITIHDLSAEYFIQF